MATEAEIRRLQQHIADLELQLAETRRSEIQVREERDIERLRSALSPSPRSSSRSNVYSGDGEIGGMEHHRDIVFNMTTIDYHNFLRCIYFGNISWKQ